MNRPSFLLACLALNIWCLSSAQTIKKPVIQATQFRKDSFFITNFGARSDASFLNTKAINAAIVHCSSRGGGIVVVPAGFWLTGPLELKSNVNLHLKANALVQFTPDKSKYDLVSSNWEGLPQMRNQSPLWANGATNIAITGKGIIDGSGEVWRMVKKDKLTESQWKKLVAGGGVLSDDKKSWYPSAQWMEASKMKNPGEIRPEKTPEFYASIKDFLRPNLLVFTSCNKVLLEGITFQNSPAWCLHPLMCKNLTVRNVTVKNPWYAQNGDGIDVESCSNVLIENSSFDVGDDGICIKSGRDEAGRKRGMPSENMIIRNNVVYAAHGGFVIGSEMSGGARNIWVDNCTFIGTDIGLRFKTTRGRGGVVENIFINNISMKNIIGDAILFDMYYAAQDPIVLNGETREPPKVETLPVDETTPLFRNFTIKGVVCYGADRAIFLRGLPEMNVKNLTMENMMFVSNKGLDFTEATGITLKNVKVVAQQNNPLINIHNSQTINLTGIDFEKAAVLMNVTGQKSSGIVLKATDQNKAQKNITTGYGATETAITVQP